MSIQGIHLTISSPTSSISGRAQRSQGKRNDLAARAPLHALVRRPASALRDKTARVTDPGHRALLAPAIDHGWCRPAARDHSCRIEHGKVTSAQTNRIARGGTGRHNEDMATATTTNR